MRLIGLTGNSGAGKSLVAKRLIELGIPVVDADHAAARVLSPKTAVYEQFIECFGKDYLQKSGEVDRKKLSELIFADEERRAALNALTHPAIIRDVFAVLKNLETDGATMAVVDAALLFESGLAKKMYLVLAVIAEPALELRRIMQRDNISEQAAAARISSQLSNKELVARADAVIINNGSMDELFAAVDDFVCKIKP